MRTTKHRQEILKVLKGAHSALSAADLHISLPHINLVTIYRNLEIFSKDRTIKKLHLYGQEAQYELQSEPHHHAICNECDEVIHFTTKDKKLIKEFALPGFTIQELDVTLRGTCDKHNLEQEPRTKTK
jgi:Fe2+ or Zn2+ uptake regulation protein